MLSRARLLCGGDWDHAEDLVSRTTLRMLRFAATCDRPIRAVGALFFVTLRNLAIDERRAARRAVQLYDRSFDMHDEDHGWRLPAASTDVESDLALERSLAAIEALVAQLPEQSRRLFHHRFVEERSCREIALILRISEPLVRKRVQRLRMLLVKTVGAADVGAASRSQRPHVYIHEIV